MRDFVKLQSQVQTSVLGLGVDFVLPLSQEQEQQQQQEEPPPKSITEFDNKDQFLLYILFKFCSSFVPYHSPSIKSNYQYGAFI